jgi:hypothetical protein
MTTFSTALAAIGMICGLCGELLILKSAYRRGLAALFSCLALPCGTWLFAALDMRRPQLALALSVGGTLLLIVGCAMLGAASVETITQ